MCLLFKCVENKQRRIHKVQEKHLSKTIKKEMEEIDIEVCQSHGFRTVRGCFTS